MQQQSALGLFEGMAKDRLEHSIAVYDSIITCLCRMRRLKEAEFTPRQIIKTGLIPDEVIYTSLMDISLWSKQRMPAVFLMKC